MQQNQARLIQLSSWEVFNQNLQLVPVMKEGAEANSIGGKLRDQYMAENFDYILKNEYPGEKAIYWAHNGHLNFDTVSAKGKTTGYYLKSEYGDQ